MRRSVKILLCIISVICIFCSVCILSLLYPIPYLTDTLNYYTEQFPWLYDVFSIYTIFMCVCFLLLIIVAVFSPNRLRKVVIKKEKGTLQFSRQTIESAIMYSYAELDEINLSKVSAKMHKNPNKLRIYVKLSLKDPSKLVEVTTVIQKKIELAMRASFDLAVKSINISVAEIETKDVSEDTKKHTRVI